jgi:hypothetical protein
MSNIPVGGSAVVGALPVVRRAPPVPVLQHRFPTRLIVALGNYGPTFDNTRGNLPFMVGHRLLKHCKYPEREIHDTNDFYANRSNNRDEFGTDRVRPLCYSSSPRKQFATFMAGKRPLQSWCTEPFKDFQGLWVDRMLLGEPPQSIKDGSVADDASSGNHVERVAMLHPGFGIDAGGDSLDLVLSRFRHFEPSQIIVVVAEPKWRLGAGSLQTVGESEFLRTPGLSSVLDSVACRFESEEAMNKVWVFRLGCDAAHSRLAGERGMQEGKSTSPSRSTSATASSTFVPPPSIGPNVPTFSSGASAPSVGAGAVRNSKSHLLSEAHLESLYPDEADEPRESEQYSKGSEEDEDELDPEFDKLRAEQERAKLLHSYSSDENKIIHSRVAPLSAFCLALWAMNPERAASYAKRNFFPAVDPFQPVHIQELSLWSSLQNSMLTTRDEAILVSQMSDWKPSHMNRRVLLSEAVRIGEKHQKK